MEIYISGLERPEAVKREIERETEREGERQTDKQIDRQTDKQIDRLRERERERELSELRERERENSELHYSMTEILGNSLFLQSVLAKLHKHIIIKIINDTFKTHTIIITKR